MQDEQSGGAFGISRQKNKRGHETSQGEFSGGFGESPTLFPHMTMSMQVRSMLTLAFGTYG